MPAPHPDLSLENEHLVIGLQLFAAGVSVLNEQIGLDRRMIKRLVKKVLKMHKERRSRKSQQELPFAPPA